MTASSFAPAIGSHARLAREASRGFQLRPRVASPLHWGQMCRRLLVLPLLVFLSAPTGVLAAETGGFVEIDSLAALRQWATRDHARVRLKPGTYVLDSADGPRFLRFTGHDSHFDLRGVTIRVDTALFSRFGPLTPADPFYCVFELTGNRIVFEGVKTENFGDRPGVQSKNKIFSISGSHVVLRDVEITTSGSRPWGYGSLFGISGGVVRKMNGIRVGAPADGVKLINCRVHMRAMGHGIFVQGATNTLIEDCHVDGLLRRTDSILEEKAGIAFDRGFKAGNGTYVEGVKVGPDGTILPGEVISLSEDGIRLYDKSGDVATGPTTIRRCTVRQMRRGICTALGPGADTIIDCEVRICVQAGFSIGSGDIVRSGKSDAMLSEALSITSPKARRSQVDLEILAAEPSPVNDTLAVLNGEGHTVRLHASHRDAVSPAMVIAIGTQRGNAYYQRGRGAAKNISLTNETAAKVVTETILP